MDISQDDIGSVAEEALCEAFNELNIPYNGQAFTKIGLLVQHWADKGILSDGELSIGDYE